MSLQLARRLSFILALLPAFGCGTKDLRTVITEHKAKVEPQLANLTAIRDAARAAPPVTHDDVAINGPAPRIGVTDVDEHVNVAIEYLEDLADLTALGNVPHRILGSGSMNRCAAIFATHRYPYNPVLAIVPDEIPSYVADDNLKHCEAVRYIFVIRSLAYAAPSRTRDSTGVCPNSYTFAPADAGTPDAGPTAAATCKVFDGGYLSADVLVFDINSGVLLGGFRFTAENAARIDIGASSEPTTALISDFSVKIHSAFKEAATKYVPGFTVGY
jgi:hypothetical protein